MPRGLHGIRHHKKSRFKTVLRRILAVLIVIVAIAGFICWGRAISVLSVHRAGTGIYAMDYHANYHLDDYLAEGILDEGALEDFVSAKLLFGRELPVTCDYKDSGGTSFFTWTSTGDYYIARNYDARESNCLVVTTHPADGHASMSTVDLSMLGMGKSANTPDAGVENRLTCLYAPFLPVDGFNDQGFSIAVCPVGAGHLKQDSGHTPLSITGAVRLCLDRASSVNEAIDLLKNFDLRSSKKTNYQFMLADANGAHAIVAYDKKSNLYTIDDTLMSDFVLDTAAGSSRAESASQFGNVTATVTGNSDDEEDENLYKPGTGDGQDTYNAEQRMLNKYGWIISEDQAFEVLEAGKATNKKWITDWSVVYNMTTRRMQIVVHEGFANRYIFEL